RVVSGIAFTERCSPTRHGQSGLPPFGRKSIVYDGNRARDGQERPTHRTGWEMDIKQSCRHARSRRTADASGDAANAVRAAGSERAENSALLECVRRAILSVGDWYHVGGRYGDGRRNLRPAGGPRAVPATGRNGGDRRWFALLAL